MNRTVALFFFFAGGAALIGAPSDIGLLPQDKKPAVVKESEPNPFGVRAKEKSAKPVVEVESEETRIRAAIERLTVGGLTRSYGVTKVLLGSHTAEAGETLPDVIPGQTEKVRVLKVTDDQIELGFVEEDGTVAERKILLGVDLEPVVRYQMHGPSASETEEMAFDGVYKDHESPLPKD